MRLPSKFLTLIPSQFPLPRLLAAPEAFRPAMVSFSLVQDSGNHSLYPLCRMSTLGVRAVDICMKTPLFLFDQKAQPDDFLSLTFREPSPELSSSEEIY